MARYIKAVECAEVISEKFNIPLSELVDEFAEIPTADVVEVVRCKDCKFRYTATCFSRHETADNDYCSCGAKMDKEGD